MKPIFDDAVKGPNEGYPFVFRKDFKVAGPLASSFTKAMGWFEGARRVGHALGIMDCEYTMTQSQDGSRAAIFSFKNEKDYMAFTIAVEGDKKGTFTRDISFSTPAKTNNGWPRLLKFIKNNKIEAEITDTQPTFFRVVTKSQFDDFAIAQAHMNGLFSTRENKKSEPNPP